MKEKKTPIPYGQLQTIFLDVGNTLVSIDFAWACEELSRLGIECQPDDLQRAEAAIRPEISAQHEYSKANPDVELYTLYFSKILKNLAKAHKQPAFRPGKIARQLKPILLAQGTQRLWSYVLPGVREALTGFKQLGLQLVAVSNADGTVEEGLGRHGLRYYFDFVVDSHIVGFEKPDPRIFYHALEISNAKAANTLHVGDMYYADVNGARAAGIHALLLDPYDDWQDVDCECVPDLLSLLKMLQ